MTVGDIVGVDRQAWSEAAEQAVGASDDEIAELLKPFTEADRYSLDRGSRWSWRVWANALRYEGESTRPFGPTT